MMKNSVFITFAVTMSLVGLFFANVDDNSPKRKPSPENDKFSHKLIKNSRDILNKKRRGPSSVEAEAEEQIKKLGSFKKGKKFKKLKLSSRKTASILGPKDKYDPYNNQRRRFSNSINKSDNVKDSSEDKFSFTSSNKSLSKVESETQSSQKNNEEKKSNPDSIVAPRIVGTIPPLVGSITYSSPSLLFSEAYAAVTCTSPSIELFDTQTMTVLEDNPLADNELKASTVFEFDPLTLTLDLSTPTRYKLRTTGCTRKFERIITSFYGNQDLTVISTLLSNVINSSVSTDISDVPGEDVAAIEKSLEGSTSVTI